MRCTLTLLILASLLATCGCSGGGGAAPPAAPSSAQTFSCQQLNGQVFSGAIITTKAFAATSTNVEYCEVKGSFNSNPGFQFQINLPATWNNKLAFSGGGGWDGSVDLGVLSSNYVVVGSNGGHSSSVGTDASFALNNPQAQKDFGYASAHTTLLVAKEIIRKRYGTDPQRQYFLGCSNGGREALMQASRYPSDYDGIVAIAPAHSFTQLLQAFIQNSQALSAPGAAINAAKASTIANAVNNQCDALDGLTDGLVSKPQACNFDVSTLLCTGADNNSCLTSAQVSAAQTIYAEYKDGAGATIYPGWGAGGEDLGWPGWLTNPPTDSLGLQYQYGAGLVKFWLTSDPAFNALNFNPSGYTTQIAAASGVLDASPNLTTFLSQGRKLVMAHGTHDWAVSYKASINYFDNVALSSAGGAAARDAGVEFFLLPGVQHCSGGVGPDQVDWFDATLQWVENGARPSSRNLSAVKIDAATKNITLSRPLCHYPLFPKYKGSGDPKVASSFSCSAT